MKSDVRRKDVRYGEGRATTASKLHPQDAEKSQGEERHVRRLRSQQQTEFKLFDFTIDLGSLCSKIPLLLSSTQDFGSGRMHVLFQSMYR